MSEKYRLLFYLKSNRSWQYFISLLLDVLLLEKKTTKISSQRKSQSIRAAKICSRKPQKITNPQNKSPAKILCYALYSSDKRPRATGFRHNFDHLSILWDKRDNCFITSFPRSPFQSRLRPFALCLVFLPLFFSLTITLRACAIFWHDCLAFSPQRPLF